MPPGRWVLLAKKITLIARLIATVYTKRLRRALTASIFLERTNYCLVLHVHYLNSLEYSFTI